MNPCKHLNHYKSYYPAAKLVSIDDLSVPVKYWKRKDPDGNAQSVQFCKRRGRITGIFQCYSEGEMNCYEPQLGGDA